MTYSTCSLNPIENEAVVAAILKKYKGKIRLVQQADEVMRGFKFTPGMTQWKFMHMKARKECEEIEKVKKDSLTQNGDEGVTKEKVSYFNEYTALEQVPEELRSYTRETMFC